MMSSLTEVSSAKRAPAKISWRPWRRSLVWLLCLGPFFYISYGLANYLAAQRDSVNAIVFAWEQFIPFWPWTIFPYWTINGFYALSLFLAPTTHILDRHGLRLLSAQVVAVLCFLIWPLTFTFGQPAVEDVSAFLFDALRSFDRPFNQAPSLHVALAIILWDYYRRLVETRWARVVVHIWTIAICGSVLTTYQHHFIDVPTGLLLGVFCVWLWPLEYCIAPMFTWRLTFDRRRWAIATFYGLGAAGFAVTAVTGYADENGWLLWLWWPAFSLAMVACIYLFAGERSFQMNAKARMHWSARWLLAPYRLLARLNAAGWTAGIAPAQELVPGVWLGHLPSDRLWYMSGKRALVSFCGELQAPAYAEAHCYPILDMTVPKPYRLLRACRLIDRALERAKKLGLDLQVCCALGFSRSAAALACWLVHHRHADTLDEAIEMLRGIRPNIVLSPAWRTAIERAIDLGRVEPSRERC